MMHDVLYSNQNLCLNQYPPLLPFLVSSHDCLPSLPPFVSLSSSHADFRRHRCMDNPNFLWRQPAKDRAGGLDYSA